MVVRSPLDLSRPAIEGFLVRSGLPWSDQV